MRFSHRDLVDYVQQYPAFIGEIFTLFKSYDLPRLKAFFENLDLTKPYIEQPSHKGYLMNKADIDKVLTAPGAYMIAHDQLDQDYLDAEHTTRVYSETVDIFEGVAEKHFPPVPRKEAMDWLSPQLKDYILEVGIGPGANFKSYPGFCDVVGIDISPASVAVAKQRVKDLGLENIIAELMDIHQTSFADNAFDKVLSLCSMCVTRNPFRAMKEIKRISKPDARIVLYEPGISVIEEVNMMLYLVQPIGRTIGAVWYDDFPPYTIPYNTYYDLSRILEVLDFEVVKKTVFDQPYNTLFMVACRNKK